MPQATRPASSIRVSLRQARLRGKANDEIDDPRAKFEQKSYALVGLVGGYDFTQDLQASVNLNNLFDLHYYSGIGNYGTLYWGVPRNMMFNLKYSF